MAPVTTLGPLYAAYCKQLRSAPKVYDGSIPLPQIRTFADEMSKNNIKNLPNVIEEDKTVVYNVPRFV